MAHASTKSRMRSALLSTASSSGSMRLLSIGDYLLLEDLGSPFVDRTEQEPAPTDITIAAYILSHPLAEVLDLYNGPGGRVAFERAVRIWAAQFPAGQLPALANEVGRQIRDAFAAMVPTAPKVGAPEATAPSSPK